MKVNSLKDSLVSHLDRLLWRWFRFCEFFCVWKIFAILLLGYPFARCLKSGNDVGENFTISAKNRIEGRRTTGEEGWWPPVVSNLWGDIILWLWVVFPSFFLFFVMLTFLMVFCVLCDALWKHQRGATTKGFRGQTVWGGIYFRTIWHHWVD